MMNKAHQIESAIVEIAFPNEQLALSQHGLFESFVRKKMFLAISDVFDEFSEENTIYSIEKLEMDLGVISTSHSYSEFESKLRSKLRESIENVPKLLCFSVESGASDRFACTRAS